MINKFTRHPMGQGAARNFACPFIALLDEVNGCDGLLGRRPKVAPRRRVTSGWQSDPSTIVPSAPADCIRRILSTFFSATSPLQRPPSRSLACCCRSAACLWSSFFFSGHTLAGLVITSWCTSGHSSNQVHLHSTHFHS